VKLVCDTNVLVAGIVAEGLCREILESHLPEHEPILSKFLWDELVGKLKSKFGLHADDLPILSLYRGRAVWVEPTRLTKRVCRDADDDWVLATARAGGAEMILTGDADLLVLESWDGIDIVTARAFLELLAR
jgi:uncharacterized protein